MSIWSRTAAVVFLASAIALSVSTTAAAQNNDDGPGAGVGFKIGPTFADFSSDAVDIDRRTGWHGGLFIGGNRSGVAGWQTEINWLRRQGTTALGEEFHIDYLQVPIFLRLNIGTKSRNGFAVYAIAGPAFEVKVADKINGVTIDDSFEGTDVGLVFGAGLEITRLILEGRYEWGFRRINKTFSSISEIKSRSFTVLAGIRFN